MIILMDFGLSRRDFDDLVFFLSLRDRSDFFSMLKLWERGAGSDAALAFDASPFGERLVLPSTLHSQASLSRSHTPNLLLFLCLPQDGKKRKSR